ncbi:MAG: hypothetical protein ABI758_06095 [Candidatus Woesebacteria bacterium]
MKKNVLDTCYRILLGVILGMFVLGQFGRFELEMGRAIYFQDILLSLFILLFSFQYPKRVIHAIRTNILLRSLIFFDLWIIFTSVLFFHNDVSQLLTSILYLIRFNVIIGFGLTLTSLVQQKIVSMREIRIGVALTTVGIALAGLAQYVFFPDTRSLVLMGWDDHLYRLISTIFDPGFTGIILAVGCLLFLYRFLQTRSYFYPTVLAFLVLFVSLLLTYSRASYLAFGAGVLYLVYLYKRISILLILLLFAAGIILLPSPAGEGVNLLRTASANARVESVQTAFSGMGPLQALIGEGWYAKKQINPLSHSSAPENSYVFIFTSLGIVGVGLWSQLVWRSLQAVKWNSVVIVSCVAIGVHALFSNTLFHPFVLLLLVTIMAGNGPLTQKLSLPKQR